MNNSKSHNQIVTDITTIVSHSGKQGGICNQSYQCIYRLKLYIINF